MGSLGIRQLETESYVANLRNNLTTLESSTTEKLRLKGRKILGLPPLGLMPSTQNDFSATK